MTFRLLTAELVEIIHDEVLNPGELQGRARDKSLDSALARVDHRIGYGMITDVFDLAATYAFVIARGHCFNDANKRTAFRAMELVLSFNGVRLDISTEEIGPRVVELAEGRLDEAELAAWLRSKA